MRLLNRLAKSSLFKASGIYTLTSVVNGAIPFLLLPILTRFLSPSEYGLVSMFSLLVSISGDLFGLSVHGALNREYFNKEIDFRKYVFNCLAILSFSTAVVTSLIFLFRNLISEYSQFPSGWLWAVVGVSFFQFGILALLSVYQAQMKAKNYSSIQLSQTILNVALSILFVVGFSFGWRGRIAAQLCAFAAVGSFSYYVLLRKWSDFRFDFSYIKRALKFGVPLIPHNIGSMLIVMTDRFIITNQLGLATTGVYTAGLQIGMIIELFASSFNKAYAPWLIQKLNENDKSVKVKIVRLTYLYFFGFACFSILAGLAAPFMVKILLGKEFSGSAAVIFWIALGGAFKGMYYMVTNYIFYAYKTHLLAWITLFSGLVNVPLTILLVKHNGISGAGQSYAICVFITFILTWILAARVHAMPWGRPRAEMGGDPE